MNDLGKQVAVVEGGAHQLIAFCLSRDGDLQIRWHRQKHGVEGGWAPWNVPCRGLGLRQVVGTKDKNGVAHAFAIGALGNLYQVRHKAGDISEWCVDPLESPLGLVQIDVYGNQDGRLAIFGIGSFGVVQYSEQTSDGSWGSWQELERGPSGPSIKQLGVQRNADGRVEVFGLSTEGHLFRNCQRQPNGGEGWCGWAAFPEKVRLKHICPARHHDRRLEVLGIGEDGDVHNVWQDGVNGARGWRGWGDIGGGLCLQDIAYSRNENGRMHLFGITASGAAYHIWLAEDWQHWRSLVPQNKTLRLRQIVVRRHHGRQAVFGIGVDGCLYHTWQERDNDDCWWHEWLNLHGGNF